MALQSGGLNYGYRILNAKEKEVHKDEFSRYSVQCYITNTSDQAKMLVRPQGSGILVSSTSYNLVRFQCTNATGARFTSKELTLQAKPCIIEAIVDDKECNSDKVVQHQRPVNIGYWIRPGETISANVIFIVPLNEKPAVMATLFPMSTGTIAGSASYLPDNTAANYPGGVHGGPGLYAGSPQGILHLRNASTGNYLNTQTNRIICIGNIRSDWESAQWELLPVNNSSYILIRNKLSGRYISVDNPSLLADQGNSSGAMWMLEPTDTPRTYTIRNAANGVRLVSRADVLAVAGPSESMAGGQWSVEQ
jgi:hypothetical protein